MKLKSSCLKEPIEATSELIESCFNLLFQGGYDDPFLILEAEDMTYVQAYVFEDGALIEWQQGALDQHFRILPAVSAAEAFRLFHSYFLGDAHWFCGYAWAHQPMRFDEPPFDVEAEAEPEGNTAAPVTDHDGETASAE